MVAVVAVAVVVEDVVVECDVGVICNDIINLAGSDARLRYLAQSLQLIISILAPGNLVTCGGVICSAVQASHAACKLIHTVTRLPVASAIRNAKFWVHGLLPLQNLLIVGRETPK